MSIIFLGDIASPNKAVSRNLQSIVSQSGSVFTGKKIVCNFEGLAFNRTLVQRNEPLLFNHSSVLESLDVGRGGILALANNHVLDYPQQLRYTREISDQNGFETCGAGFTREEAEQPVELYDGETKILLYNACWDFLLYNHSNPREGVHVAELNEKKLINEVKSTKENEPGTRIVIYLHWSLDLEILPFPLYRQFARDIIKAGAELVIGSHSHCVQGGEKFSDGYAIYGLGNFLIPNNEYAGGNLNFPDLSKTELAVEWDPVSGELTCHWFEYNGKEKGHQVILVGSEKFEQSDKIRHFTPYTNMSDHEYIGYFRKYRRKKILIPVYTDYRKIFRNKLYTILLKTRARTAHFLATLNIVKWQN